MADRRLPVRPDLDQLRNQAKDLFRRNPPRRSGRDRGMKRHHPSSVEPRDAKLADAQLVLARSYSPERPRLVLACRVTDAIWRDDLHAVRKMVLKHPRLLHERPGTEHQLGPADDVRRQPRS